MASRITALARPGSVLVEAAVRDAVDGAFSYSFAGERRLKGFDSRVGLFRARRATEER
jgi:adenylate cyclase